MKPLETLTKDDITVESKFSGNESHPLFFSGKIPDK